MMKLLKYKEQCETAGERAPGVFIQRLVNEACKEAELSLDRNGGLFGQTSLYATKTWTTHYQADYHHGISQKGMLPA